MNLSKYSDKKEDYEKVLGKSKSYQWIAIAFSTLSGGFIAGFKLDWAIAFSVVPLIFSALFALRLNEVPKVETTGEVHYLEYIKIARGEIKTNRVLLYLMVYLLALSVFGSIGDFDQLYYQLVKLPIYAFGIAGFLGAALSAIGTYYVYKIKKFAPGLYLLPFISGILLVFAARYPSVPMIIVLLGSYFISSSLTVLIESNLQHSISSVSRATITSAGKLGTNSFAIILAPVFGLVANVWNLQAIYLTAGVFILVFSLWVVVVRNKVAVTAVNG